MKKSVKITATVMAVAMCGMLGVGCGDSGKKNPANEIVIEPFSGSGFGYQWIKDLAAEWTKENPDWKISVKESSVNLSGTQLSQIEAGTTTTDVYFGADANYNSGFYKGYFEDLTDMLTMKPDGENGLTIQQKILNYDTWKTVAGKLSYDATTGAYSSSGLYMLPHSVAMTGLVYDHSQFVSLGYLTYAENSDSVKSALTAQGIAYEEDGAKLVFKSGSQGLTHYEEGDYILSAGKDGKYGTYDDGQPQTMAEFKTMVNNIVAGGKTPFVYASSASDDYVTQLVYEYLVQYAGLDAYDALTAFDSNGKEIKMQDGSSKVITWDNGYETYKMDGVEAAVNFLNEYFYSNDNYYTTGNFVSDAQDKFINGGVDGDKFIGMLVEGNWFETEASESMKAAGKRDPERGYGKVDYRFMLLPDIDGQKGIDGNGHGSVFSASEAGAIVVRKQSDSAKLSAIKSFISYTLSNASLSYTTATTGLIRAYKYSLSDEQLASMTPFNRTCYEIYSDTENVKILTSATDMLRAPFAYATSGWTAYQTLLPYNGTFSLIVALRSGKSVTEIVNSIRNSYTATQWAGYVESIKNSL